jgi:DNA (cytosine-5)-methyltransferase 1
MKKQTVESKKTTSKRKSPKSKKLACVDLFCGCGGMSLGFAKAGFDVKAGFELWEPAINVYKANFKHPIIKQDLSDLDDAIPKIAEYKPDLIVGGPPCQDFSIAGHKDESLGRAILSVFYSRIVSSIRPKYFVMENVANIRNFKAFKKVLDNFRMAGYGVTLRILDAAYCGVPQTRKRMFVVGSFGENDEFLGKELDAGLADKPMSVHDYLGDSLGIEHYFRIPTTYSRRAVFSIYEPSATIRGVDRPIPKGYKGHPNDSAPVSETRILTPKERSYIQTFPREFKLEGSKTDLNMMIGNAVPVNLAKFVGRSLMRHIKARQKETCDARR